MESALSIQEMKDGLFLLSSGLFLGFLLGSLLTYALLLGRK